MEVDAGSSEGAAAAGGRKAPRRRRGRRRGAKDHKGEFENVPDTEAANHGTTPPLPSLVALEAPQRRSPLGGLVPRIFAA